ncbi:MAG: GntR family transcriptional regulator [Verrucomicrobiota bacterium]
MLPFDAQLTSGSPIYEQLDKAIRRALAARQIRPGDAFPSVRSISKELRINPNTTHKVIATLVADGLLEVVPGRGTFVSHTLPESKDLRAGLLQSDAERLVAEARKLKISRRELDDLINKLWRKENDD